MQNENPFKKISLPPKEVPFGLKKMVMTDIASVKLLIDMSALFTSNYRSTLASLFLRKKRK